MTGSESGMEGKGALSLSFRLKGMTQVEIGLDLGHTPPLQESPYILTGSTNQDRALAARLDLSERGTSIPQITSKVVLLGRVNMIDAVVRNSRPLGRSGFGCPNLEPAVHLTTVSANHFAIERFGKMDPPIGLAAGGVPDNCNNGRDQGDRLKHRQVASSSAQSRA